jgi:hypothetical protein
MIIPFRGKNLLVHGWQRSNFFFRKNFVVVFDDFLKFTGWQPFPFASGANFDRLAVVFAGLEDRAAPWAFHIWRLDGGEYA